MSEQADFTVMILGATGNLGQACSQVFLDQGARIVAVDRSPERLEAMAADWDRDRHLLMGGVDLTDEDAVSGLVGFAWSQCGRIDAVVNTVGAFRGGQSVESEPLATWDFLMQVNLMPALLVSKAVIPLMRKHRSGSIVHIASKNALRGAANYAGYSAAKAALLRLTESLADEVKADRITVNCVVPGTIDTPQNRADMPDADVSRWVSPAAIASVISFLTSPGAAAVTGATIPIYGTG